MELLCIPVDLLLVLIPPAFSKLLKDPLIINFVLRKRESNEGSKHLAFSEDPCSRHML